MRSIGGLLLTTLVLAAADNPAPANNAWTLQYSDPSRESRFLDIPLNYGDWVPIDHAKALVERVANRFQGQDSLVAPQSQRSPAQGKQPQAPARQDQAEDRVDSGEVQYVDNYRRSKQHPYPPQRHQQQPQRRPQQQHKQQPQNHRRQDVRFPGQSQPHHYNNNRRNRKLPPPKPHQNNVFRGKPQKQPVSQQNQGWSFNPFKFFETPKSATFTTPRSQQHQQEQSYLESLNAIQTIPAPDLSKFGPPVIELDSGADGQIILGQNNYQFAGDERDHLAGFVSVDFDGFTPGDRDIKKSRKKQGKEKLSILVGTNPELTSNGESDLVNFLNNDRDNTEAFVTNSRNKAPAGFSKIDLPFMDPTKHKGFLPKAFIAPKGIAIPKGYKGKPLPQRPEEVAAPGPGSWVEITTRRPVVLVTAAPEQVLKTQEVEDNVKPISLFDRRPSAFLRPKPTPEIEVTQPTESATSTESSKASANSFRFKLQQQKARARPSFQEYLRNKKKAELINDEYSRPEKKDPYRKNQNLDRVYVNTKIEKTRKGSRSTESPSTFQLPTEYQSTNVFSLVNDSEVQPTDEAQAAKDETDELVNTFFAGTNNAFLGPDIDDDTISIVYQPADDFARSETTTVFSPTVLPPVAETTTAFVEQVETTTSLETEITSTTTTTTTTTSTTTTSTTTTLPTTTAATTTEEIQVPTTGQPIVRPSTTFKPTKGSTTTQDPLDKLEALRKIKQGLVVPKPEVYQEDLLTGEDIDESIDVVTDGPIFNFAKPFRSRFKLKKFKNLSGLKAQLVEGQKSGSSFPPPGFGKRIRSRKRPAFLNGRFRQGLGLGGSVEPTVRPVGPYKIRTRLVPSPTEAAAGDDTEVVVKTEEVKRKLRPFFDQLYKEVVQGGEGGAGSVDSRRYGLPRRRSTTGAPPITVDAEIYEVDPRTRLRITTRKPSTTEQKILTAEPTTSNLAQESSSVDSDYYTFQEDYLYEPTTEASEDADVTTPPFEEVTTKLYKPTPHLSTLGEMPDQATTDSDSLSAWVSTTISQIFSTTEPATTSTEVDDVHETADKHSTTTQAPKEAVTFDNIKDNEIEDGDVVKPVSEVELELLALDVANEIVDQVYEESQVHETTFKGKHEDEEHTVANGRLTSYEKNIDTSHYGEDKEYNKDDLKNVVNEHGQQQPSTNDAVWNAVKPFKPYHTLNRNNGDEPTVTIEDLEITQSKDYSETDIIYDHSHDSFDNEGTADSYSVPVSVAFNVPETTATTPEATQSTTELAATTTTTLFEEPTTVTATTERHYRHYNPTTYSRLYSFVNRNRKHPLSTTTEGPSIEVFLGSTRRSILDLTGAQTAAPTTAERLFDATQKTYESAHKIPGKLWSAYEISRQGGETTTEEIDIEPVPEVSPQEFEEHNEATSVEREEINTEGFNLAGVMSYSMPDENSNATALPGIVEIDDLPKPNEHESQVLVIEQIPESATNDPTFHKLPKSLVFNPTEDTGTTFGAEQLIPLRQKDGKYAKKFETKTKKREEWIRNWVDRKYNKPKFPRGPLLPLAPATHSQETTVQTTTEEPEKDDSILADSAQNEPQHSLLVPTIPPKITSDVLNLAKIGSAEPTVQPTQPNSRFNVNLDVTVRDGSIETPLPELSDLKSSLLEKYAGSRHKNKNKKKNSLFKKKETKSRPAFSSGVIRGADTDLFRSYGGKSLSQSDFERQILGVSTATEISVRSMICVKGRCFNANDMGKLLSK